MMTTKMMSEKCVNCGFKYQQHKAFTFHCPKFLNNNSQFSDTFIFTLPGTLHSGGTKVSNPYYPKGNPMKPVINVVIPCKDSKEADALLKKIAKLTAGDEDDSSDEEEEEDEKPAKKAKKPAKDEDDSDDEEEDEKPAKKKKPAKDEEEEDEPGEDDEVGIEVGMKVTAEIDDEKVKGCKIVKIMEKEEKVKVKTPDGDTHTVGLDALSV